LDETYEEQILEKKISFPKSFTLPSVSVAAVFFMKHRRVLLFSCSSVSLPQGRKLLQLLPRKVIAVKCKHQYVS
jgi:hypothetical protein